jgi:hypothetical protein
VVVGTEVGLSCLRQSYGVTGLRHRI